MTTTQIILVIAAVVAIIAALAAAGGGGPHITQITRTVDKDKSGPKDGADA